MMTYSLMLTHLGADDEPCELRGDIDAPTGQAAIAYARTVARQRVDSLRTEITWALYDGSKLLDWDIVQPNLQRP